MELAQAPQPMAVPSPALQHCFDEVTDSAPMALERCLAQVVSVLQEAEGKSTQAAERAELGAAWRELLQHQRAWCEGYPNELRALFRAASRASGGRAGTPGQAQPAARVELALMDDDALDEAIAAARLIQHVMPIVERPVSELDALVSSAMGLDTVHPELNPVRPEVFAQSLRALIDRTDVTAATGSLWMKHMAEPLGHELQQLYGRLVVQLKQAKVQAAGYRVTHGAEAPAGAHSGAAARSDAMAGPQAAEPAATTGYGTLSPRQITHSLLRNFLRTGGGEQAVQPLPASYYAEVDRELARLKTEAEGGRDVAPQAPVTQQYRELPPVDRPARPVGVQSTLDAQVWGDYARSHERSLVRARLRRDARRVAQVLGLELVRKVVNQVAQDPRLLAPVREGIVALEPSLLRLAMVDPRFFSEEQHPGRLLMERTAQRSFKYNDEFAADFAAFFDGINRSFNNLNQAEIPDSQPFEQALAALAAAWAEQDQLEADPRVQALRAMQFAEKRQAEADRIAWELSSRTDLEAVPSVVRDFLFGPWALVLAQARLTDPARQIDPQGYLSVISDLLWSVKPEVTLRQPAQLFERVPPLLAKLRAGLASIGRPPDASEHFFDELMQLHRPVLKLRRAKSRRDARESGVAPLTAVEMGSAPAQPRAADKAAEGEPWLSARELGALGFQETLPTDMAQLEAEQEVDAQGCIANFREGDWIDLYSRRRWHRAQLIWASSRGTLFMFISHGGRPHSMTKRICERLIGEGFLRPVRMHGVVAGALDALEREEAPA